VYTAGINPANLPQTIRDAIYVTHELGMQYLWADTLCIIQDSGQDKRRELARMHRIYRDAHLTIIASDARKVSEGFLQDRPDAAVRDVVLPFVCPPVLVGGPPQLGRRWHRLHAAWWKVVVDYTQRSITSPTDKLVACGAIAAEFGRVLSTEYLAGLWRDTQLNDLLWFKRPASANVARPAVYRAPSWSWAAVDGAVSKHVGEWAAPAAAVAEVVSSEIVLEDAALPFGQVTGGSLVLSAALVPCEWGQDRPYDGLRFMAHQHEDPPGRLDEESVLGGKAKSALFARGYIDSEPDDAGIRGLWAVPLFRNGPYYVDGLVVSRGVSLDGSGLPQAMESSYRRVGIFRMIEPVVQALGLDGELQVTEIKLV
ncbi:uncharacterized protein TRAVEDRAFT_135799, partial [Trametes versicolor FP-101664 SS1]|uniref:uncharacterized protein n=1 Tax=Trametes versicolor (strain FP-101664) TaxID=717944 RepID=UPI0004621C8D